MHSRLLTLFWRRKLLLLASSVLFLLALWFWGFLYTTHVNDGGKIVSIKELMMGGGGSGTSLSGAHRENLLQRLGFYDELLDETGAGGVKFVKPTVEGLLARSRAKFFNEWEAIMQDRDEKPHSAREINKRRSTEELRIAAEKQNHYEHELKKMGVPVIAGIGPGGHPPPLQRLVHLDLKGAPPKIAYLKRLMPIMKTLGATGILLEYEDMFPYGGPLSPITARNAYQKEELTEILKTAFALGLAVIPLVQTFGHLEFVLKLQEFTHLREVEDSPQALCPSKNASMVFLEEMLEQVIDFHTPAKNINLFRKEDVEKLTPKLTHIHIGCDEVYQIAQCSRCKNRLKDQLFLDHVYNVASIIRKKWPHMKIIIWDDMLRHMPVETLQASGIGKLVEPMIWVYAEDIYKFIQSSTWDKYSIVFNTAWAASAFKGAHGETLLIPPIRRHLENTLRWLAVMQGEGSRFPDGLQGLALTGWQRYDHFAVLCEMLPTALPSLAVCLSTASRGYFDVNPKTNPILSSLTCPEPTSDRHAWIELHKDSILSTFSRCMFPGSVIYRFMLRLMTLINEAKEYIDDVKQKRGWLTDYNVRHNFTSGTRVDDLLGEDYRLLNSITNLARNAASTLADVYDHWTSGEFIEQRIYPILAELKHLERIGDDLKKRKTWPQRPLPYLKPFEALGIDEKT
ncbi:hexosaminidase D-like [Uranotaenia lowii]|uniref:hexosaminidase D-like n=1 Tax=Uranotaenia lowii TaxID=190385 RepID=UPI00247B270B|nr:hexosaminidase D-like [Uranotaenia lowii]